jgi:hypothetical protein
MVEKILQSFDSHEEADQANKDYYASLSNQDRIRISLELMASYYEAFPRLERIYRAVDLGECPVSADRWMGEDVKQS